MSPAVASRAGATILAAALLGVAACTAADDDAATVFAAASLANSFTELGEGSDAAARYSFDGSNSLVDQIIGGAPADVFAAADIRTMERAVAEGITRGDPVRFATNVLVLVTPAGNPAGVTGLDDSLAGAKLVVCAPEVPCGNASHALADELGVELQPVSEEGSVTDVLGKVRSGEADAGLVYATDAAGAGDAVETIGIPGTAASPNEYWVVALEGGDAAAAGAFIDLVTGPEGQGTLAEHGFGPA